MPVLKIIMDGTIERSGPDFDPTKVEHIQTPIAVIGMPRGMASMQPSIMFRFTLNDGREVFAETSLALFVTAADGLRAYYNGRT